MKRAMKLIPRIGILVILAAFVGGAAAPKQKEKPTQQPKATEETKPAQTTTKPATVVDPKDPKSILYMDTKGNLAGTGDVTKSGVSSEAAKAGAGWHPTALSGVVVPKDRYGLVDWAKTIREKIIAPRHSLDPEMTEEDAEPLDMNVEIKAKSDFVNDVIFPHAIHTYWFACEGCHEKIFKTAAGQNDMTMAGIAEGKWCGKCHGKVAFPLVDCNRCHTKPRVGAK